MAVVLEQQKRKTNWFAVVVFIFILAVILGLAYFLFFAPTPGIEIIAPSQLEEAAGLAELELDSNKLISDPVLKSLKQYGTQPSIGVLGKDNPFVGF